MQFRSFEVAALPRIVFGEGRITELPDIVRGFGTRVLVVTGARSFRQSPAWSRLQQDFTALGIDWLHVQVDGEPSPQLVDDAVRSIAGRGVETVVAIGGGSAIDAAKAMAGLLPEGNSVFDHLEDVGSGIPYRGPALPLIAVPTTAGTGSEATKNAVLSVRSPDGYKKSFRHELLTPRVALIDPVLLNSCPRRLIAANGMDALTQLLESFVSLRSSPFTDALARSGLRAVKEGLIPAWEGGEGEAAARGRAAMAYAALLSGITLAHAGLGSVHGLAQPLGSFYPIPHGVACGATLAAATAANISALLQREPGSEALDKYAEMGRLFGDLDSRAGREEACQELTGLVAQLAERLGVPGLSQYGVREADIGKIVANSRGNSMKTNPIALDDAEIGAIVRSSL